MSVEKFEPEIKPGTTKLNPDNIFEEIGRFGKYQLFVYFLICVPLMLIASCNFSYIFIANDMEYRCSIPECESYQNDSKEWMFKAIPHVDGKISKCDRFNPLLFNETNNSECPWNFNQSDVVRCENFVYLTDERTLLNEFNLTCDNNQWKLTIVGSLVYLAECIALPFIGLIADRYGRRPTFIAVIFFASVFGMAKSFSTNYLTFIILHFIGTIFGGGVFSIVFVFGSEVVGPSGRGLGAGIVSSAFSSGQILLAVVAMFITDFRILLRCLYGLVAFVLTFIWLVPESARWLFSVGRHEEGHKILQKMAKFNGVEISIDNDVPKHYEKDLLLDGSKKDNKKTEGNEMIRALKSKVLFSRLIICCYGFFTNALIYIGLSVYSSSLAGNKYMNLMYAGLAELPGNAAAHFVLKRYGRKYSLITSSLVCAVACILSDITSDASLKLIFLLVGKLTIALSSSMLHLYSVELFPTNLRQRMFNTCMVFTASGAMVAPQLPLLRKFNSSLLLILFGGTSFTSALLLLLLPETRNKSMPDTVDDAVNIR